jgi:hypothetical protein
MTLEDINELKKAPGVAAVKSDIEAHLPKLKELSRGLRVTEFGVRTGVSTRAILEGWPMSYHGYDLKKYPQVDTLKDWAKERGIPFHFHQENILVAEIEPTDFLFIDSTHTYDHMKKELERHAHKVSTYLAFHDVCEPGFFRESGYVGVDLAESKGERIETRPIIEAIIEFVDRHPEWVRAYYTDKDHGFMVLKKV